MTLQGQMPGVDELLDRAGDAVARNDWELAKTLAQAVLAYAPHHAEAELVLRTATTCLDTALAPNDPLSTSRDLRFMSFMFCDVVASTRLARTLGDARWRDLLEGFRRRCARAVRRYDGYIHGASGDELLILFGYPRLREDDARRAVLAGLDIIASIRAFSPLLEQEHGVAFQVRVGIHTGRALIRARERSGDLSTGVAEIGDGLVGTAANIAKRIETAAKPDTVWVSRATRLIVEGFFEFVPPPDGERQLVEFGSGITSYQVSRGTAALNRHQIPRVRSDDMIGRRPEREQLLALWERAKTEGAPFVIVSGQAGIGKSRLVEFLAETAAGSRGSRLECICTEILRPVAFAPVIGVLERFANIRQTDEAGTRLAKLDAAFREMSPEFAAFMPYLAWMMSLPRADNLELKELEPAVVRTRIFDALLKVLTLAASIRPLVFWIEDLQCADHSTQEFCRRLEAHGPIPGLIVVATMRTEYERSRATGPWSDEELATGRIVTIELGPLSPEESRELIAARSGPARDEGLTAAILESGGGNPLYLEEVTRSVTSGLEARQQPAERPSIGIPESLQPIFAQIVDRLGSDRHVAQMASLLGRDLPEPLTRTVIANILVLRDDDVVASLARLIDAEVIEPVLTELSPGYRFRHDLIREGLAHSVGPDAVESHNRIAHVIERLFPEYAQERPALLAYHYARAERYEQAAAHWLAAGVKLQGKAAHREAIAVFDHGLESMSALGHPSDPTDVARLELALRASRGVSVQTSHGYTDRRAGDDWTRAYELSRQIGAEGALVPALTGLWSFCFVQGAHAFVNVLGTTAIQVAEQILDAAGADREAQVLGYVCLAYSQYYGGDLAAGLASAERSWAIYDTIRDRASFIHVPQDPGLAALNLLGPVRWSLGDQAGGQHASEQSRALAAALDSKRAINLARIGQTNAWLHQIRRDYPQALAAADQALELAREFRVDWAVVNLSIHKGLAMAHLQADEQGIQEGMAIAKENLSYWRAGGAETFVPYFLGTLAEAYHRIGSHTIALDLVNEALAVGDNIGEHCHDAELYRVRGQTRLAADDRANGLEDLLAAVERARDQRATSFEIRSTVSLLNATSDLPDRGIWPDRAIWVDGLERAVQSLQSSENGVDEREARLLIARARRM